MALGAASADGFGLRRRLAPGGSATFRPWEAQMFRDFFTKTSKSEEFTVRKPPEFRCFNQKEINPDLFYG